MPSSQEDDINNKYNKYRQGMQGDHLRRTTKSVDTEDTTLGMGPPPVRSQSQPMPQSQSQSQSPSQPQPTRTTATTERSTTPPPIYSAPTTDTLGDESVYHTRPYAIQTPTRYRRPIERFNPEVVPSSSSSNNRVGTASLSSTPQRSRNGNGNGNGNGATTNGSIMGTPSRGGTPSKGASGGTNGNSGISTSYSYMSSSTPTRRPGPSSTTGTDNLSPRRASKHPQPKAPLPHHLNSNQHQQAHMNRRRRRRRKGVTIEKANRDFQHSEDLLSVQIKSVNTGQRSAFELNPVLGVHEWHAVAEQGAAFRQTSMQKRMSPSLQHLELLHAMQGMTVCRQLDFSPSTSPHSDLFMNWDEVDDLGGMIGGGVAGGGGSGGGGVPGKITKRFRDGRYRQIDPVYATKQALPESIPLLSNKKMRLPMRSDVGFPNAGAEEIERKQREIQHETEWEEASPRLCVLVTSDDLGTAVHEDTHHLHRWSEDHLFWNGGGLPGIPFAGKQLIQAKERNAVHFGRPTTGLAGFLKPSPYGMLAPPLDASYSPSQGWRPRPFHDRPAGMAYCLACPVSVQLEVGKVEPLICSLTLYTLPPDKIARKGQAYGKMSEAFWFPAGDWKDRVQLDAVRGSDGNIDEELLSCWFDRKHKAIFSYDPLALPAGGRESLYVVLQVYRMAHLPDDATPGLANKVFEKFGTQLLSPMCFGVSRFFPKARGGVLPEEMDWPRGEKRDTQLFSFPPEPESEDAFVERLTDVAHRISSGGNIASPSSGNEDDISIESETTDIKPSLSAASSESTAKKRGVVGRLFRSPMKTPKARPSKMSDPDPPSKPRNNVVNNVILEGQGDIFVSSLSVDFLQSMLASPPEFGEGSRERQRELPQLLVDVTGNFAVLLDPNQSQEAEPASMESVKKRSNLLRLPTPTKPAGYMGPSEYREVLYLPARLEKHYDVDSPVSYRSLLNFLYLYPRLIRLAGKTNDESPASYTIRIRVIHTEAIVDEDTGQVGSRIAPLSSFYNRSAWAGPGLLKSAYTKVVEANPQRIANLKTGIPMKDEIKMQLPKVLDGSYSLQITLCSFDLSAVLHPVAEATIPLSSASAPFGKSGARVTTVIPNGNHRVKLGNFQLELETRLVSSLHVGDPAVAIALRDFPYAKDHEDDRLHNSSGLFLGPARTKAHSEESVADFNDSFSSLLSVASESTVLGHFQLFLYMHLCNLVNIRDKNDPTGTSATFMMGNMQSLFELLRKVKSKLIHTRTSAIGKRRLQAFFKKHLDTLDEGFLSPVSSPWTGKTGSDLEVASVAGSDAMALDTNASQGDDSDDEDKDEGDNRDEGAVRIRSKKSFLQSQRVSRIVAALGTTDIPFSRVAYGATKTDRMRIEAELHKNETASVNFFDDDETVATAHTIADISKVKEGNGSAAKNLWGINADGEGVPDDMSHNSMVRSTSSTSTPAPRSDSRRNIVNTEFAQRVKTAAQVMLAPCVGPSLSSVLATGTTSPRRASSEAEQMDRSKSNDAAPHSAAKRFVSSPGSDVEDEIILDTNETVESVSRRHETVFRGPADGPLLLFSIKSPDGHEVPIASGEYIYESIMVLWLGAWLDHMEGSLTETLDTSSFTGREVATFTIPEYDPAVAADDSIYSFYAHMDFLLPLCLKSIVLRYSVEVLPMYPQSTRAMVDDSHMIVLEPFVEMLARGLMGQALAGLGSSGERDSALLRALSASELVLDFLVGLLTVLHAEHMRVLISKYFKTLRDSETEHLAEGFSDVEFEWTEESLHRVRCSRQLRLFAVETIAVLPSFLALNYPLKHSGHSEDESLKKASWMHQYSEITPDSSSTTEHPVYSDGIERLPVSGWLADIVLTEGLSVCALSCEAVVAEAMAHAEVSRIDKSYSPPLMASSLKKRPGAALKRGDLLMFQSMAIHAITAVYELIVRRHTMDKRFQTESCRGRIAALFALPILEKSISSVRWLARMESTHKVRSIWLLCFSYVLQETPEVMIREYVRSFCSPKNVRIHRFIRLLRLSSSTFQSFVDLSRHTMLPSGIDRRMSPWLLQESFNTICAATNIVVEECVKLTTSYPQEQRKIMQGILDLLLHVLTTPQSPVTHLRAVGGALQALEQFGVEAFLEITGSALQHWIRVVFGLMNSISLSVRSIAVDFVVSLLGNTFDLLGNIDEISIIFVSVLPEVVAREIALYSVAGHVSTMEDVSKALWPLRRAISDLEDTNPLDDDRVDSQLAPVLSVFCRACQAVMDGVLVEMRLRGEGLTIVGTRVPTEQLSDATFDADEESLFESANFFVPETAPMQRIRWLLTLKALHEAKGQWVEAAEALLLCARTISDSMPHLKSVWRPSRFILWSDSKRSLWLETVGEDMGHPDRGNTQVMDFADDFLEPEFILGTPITVSSAGKLQQPTVSAMCTMLTNITKEAVGFYLREDGMDELAYYRLENLLRAVMNVLEDHNPHGMGRGAFRGMGASARRRYVEEEASLRRVLASLSGDMTRLAERLLLTVENEPATPDASSSSSPTSPKKQVLKRPCYVVVRIFGKKPARFEESTTIPTFLEWDTPCVCRVPKTADQKPSRDISKWAKKLCLEFARPLLFSLQNECGTDSVILRTEPGGDLFPDPGMTYLHVFPASTDNIPGQERGPSMSTSNALNSKRFFYPKDSGGKKSKTASAAVLVELTVAHTFPCALSRQRSLLTTEILSAPKAPTAAR